MGGKERRGGGKDGGKEEGGKEKEKNTNSYWESVLISSGIHGNQWEQTGTSTIPL